MKTWFDSLRAAVRTRGLTQQQLADRLGVSQSAISHWFSGERTPSIATIKRIAAILDMSVQELIGDQAIILDSDRERELIALFRELEERDQETIEKLIKTLQK